MTPNTWHGCYAAGWQDLIVPEARGLLSMPMPQNDIATHRTGAMALLQDRSAAYRARQRNQAQPSAILTSCLPVVVGNKYTPTAFAAARGIVPCIARGFSYPSTAATTIDATIRGIVKDGFRADWARQKRFLYQACHIVDRPKFIRQGWRA